MTHDEARKQAAILLAYAENKPIQYKVKNTREWVTTSGNLGFDWKTFDYRIKPEVVRYLRYICRNEDDDACIESTYTQAGAVAAMVRKGFVRFIDTEWQEEEV